MMLLILTAGYTTSRSGSSCSIIVPLSDTSLTFIVCRCIVLVLESAPLTTSATTTTSTAVGTINHANLSVKRYQGHSSLLLLL